MSSHRKLLRPLAISYYERDEFSDSKVVKGPISFEVFEKRYRSKEWPSVNHKTSIWNGTEFKQWTPIYRIDDIFKKLDPKKHRELKQIQQQQKDTNIHSANTNTNTNTSTNTNKKQRKKRKNTRTYFMNKINISRWCYCCPLSHVSLELLKWLLISRGMIFLFVFIIRYFLYFHAFDASNLISNDNLHILSQSRLDFYSLKYLSSFSNWDGEYFLHIAQFGYEHEKIYAFYPGLPLIINSIILFIQNNPLLAIKKLHFKSMALICGITWNGLISSYLSSLILYYLTIKIYNKPSIALISSKLFLINPASIFFVSIYTESTFSFCSFLLMLCCELKYFDYNFRTAQYIHSLILMLSILLCIIIASSLRSNGILMVGFPIFYHIYTNFFIQNDIINALSLLNPNYICALKIQLKLIVTCMVNFIVLIFFLGGALTPWIYYNFYFSKNKLCTNIDSHLYSRTYCHHFYATVYSFVQGRYWQCGFLKRWNVNEIGNFILAAPIWFISFHAIKYYVRKFILISSFHTSKNLNINLMQVRMNNESAQKQNGYHNHHKNGKITISSGLKLLRSMGMIQNTNANKSARQLFDNEILLNHKLIPYVVYWFLSWMICVFYAHVQISTRFICCSCPPLYWFCAQIILSYNKNEKTNKKKKNKFVNVLCKKISQKPSPKLIVSYFLLYFTIGTIAFSAYLPFV